MVVLGNWSDEMILFFNQVGMYCEENEIGAAEAKKMFERGIAERVSGRLDSSRIAEPADITS